MTVHVAAPVAAGLVAGAAFIAVFAIWADEPPIYRIASMKGQAITIPEGASAAEANFEPATASIEAGDFVLWENKEVVAVNIVIEPACEPSQGYSANVTPSGTEKLVGPGESFGCTFGKAGEYRVHTEPWPWMLGTVSVSP